MVATAARWHRWLVVAAVIGAVGCGGAEKSKGLRLTGKVVYKGTGEAADGEDVQSRRGPLSLVADWLGTMWFGARGECCHRILSARTLQQLGRTSVAGVLG